MSPPPSPLRGLRDLRAMLLYLAPFLHGSCGVTRPSPSVASVTSVRCFPFKRPSCTEANASPRPPSMGMPWNFRSAFPNQKVEINSLVRLQHVIEK
jgi:hypothetical protein